MSNLFNRLPGFQKTPAGQERQVLRRLPGILALGTLLLCLPSLMARMWWAGAPDYEVAARITTWISTPSACWFCTGRWC